MLLREIIYLAFHPSTLATICNTIDTLKPTIKLYKQPSINLNHEAIHEICEYLHLVKITRLTIGGGLIKLPRKSYTACHELHSSLVWPQTFHVRHSYITGNTIGNKEFCMGGSKMKTLLYYSYSTTRCEQCYMKAVIEPETRNQ